MKKIQPPSPGALPPLARPEPPRLLPCSVGVTSLTFLGDTIPGDTPGPAAGALAAPPPGAPLSMPRTFSTALLSPFAQGSLFTDPNPALRLAESRRFDSSRSTARFCSRRGPGPQSWKQPGVAQPPSLKEMSPSQVVMQATWPPWPQPWHQVQSEEPLGRGAVAPASSRRRTSDGGRGSVFAEERVDTRDVVSERGSSSRSEETADCSAASVHSGGGCMLMQIGQGSWGVLQR